MTAETPTADELLAAVADLLRYQLRPLLAGRARYDAVVAANALDLVRREISAIKSDGDSPNRASPSHAEVAELIRTQQLHPSKALAGELANQIYPLLQIANPRYDEYRGDRTLRAALREAICRVDQEHKSYES